MILVPLRVFSLKRSSAGALGVPLRVLSVFLSEEEVKGAVGDGKEGGGQ